MKRFTLLLSAMLAFQATSYSGTIDPPVSLYSIITSPISGFKDHQEAEMVIQSILDVVGLCPNFEIRQANVKNAVANIKNNKRYILYNSKYISRISQEGHSNWAGISVLAHEIGHHLNGHTISYGKSNHDAELEADEFSGFVLRKMGATLPEAQAGLNAIGKSHSSKTHPGKSDRLTAIEKGWKKADKQMEPISNKKGKKKN